MLKRIFNYYFIPIEVEVKQSTGTKFKMTITSDAKLRIKLPRNCNNNDERKWINRGKIIAKYFQLHPHEFTLRTETRYPLCDIILRINDKSSAYRVIKTNITKVKR